MKRRVIQLVLLLLLVPITTSLGCQGTSNRLDRHVTDETLSTLPRGMSRAEVEKTVHSEGMPLFFARSDGGAAYAAQYSFLQSWNRYEFIYENDRLTKIIEMPHVEPAIREITEGRLAGSRIIVRKPIDPANRLRAFFDAPDLNGQALLDSLSQVRIAEAKRQGSPSNLGPVPVLVAPMVVPMSVVGGPVYLADQAGSTSFWRKHDIRRLNLGMSASEIDKLYGRPREVRQGNDQEIRLYGKKPTRDEDGVRVFVGVWAILENGRLIRAFSSEFVNETHPADIEQD